MKISVLKLVLLALCICTQGIAAKATADNWPLRLGMQTYTFRGMTLVDALEETRKLGIDYVQVYPGQELGAGFGENERFNHSMPAASRERLLQIASDKGVRIGSYGVVTGKDDAEWEQIFLFASEMGMDSVAVEPQQDAWGTAFAAIMRLSQQYGIAFGLHNHVTKMSPEQTLAELAKINPHLPLFPDTAHWVRSGFDPVAGLRAAQGRLAGIHMTDVDEKSPKAIDTPWGEGIAYISGQLAQLRRQRFGGVIFMEFGMGKMTPEFQQFIIREATASTGYFRHAEAATDAQLVEGAVVPPGFVTIDKAADITRNTDAGQWPQPSPLFDARLSNATVSAGGSWKWNGEQLSGSGDMLTRSDYTNYIINLDFRAQKDGRSAILLNAPNGDVASALKVLIRQADNTDDKQLVGAVEGCAPVSRPIAIEPGKWYHMTVMVNRGTVTVILDGETMVDMRIRNWTTAGRNPDGTPNAYKVPVKDLLKRGKVGLADTGGKVEFANITLEAL